MAPRRKVTPDVQETIVSEWLSWQLGHHPDSTLEEHLTGLGLPVGVQQMYRYIPEHLKRASKEELKTYQETGWEIPLALRNPPPAAGDAASRHFLELWASADADAKAARLQVERIRATIQTVLEMDPDLSRHTKATLKAALK